MHLPHSHKLDINPHPIADCDVRYSSKQEFLASVELEHRRLLELLSSVPLSRYKETGVWGDGWTIHDLLAHLSEWEQMCLRWFREGKGGGDPAIPAPGYKYSEIKALNREIQRRYSGQPGEKVRNDFERSYEEIHALIASLTDRELLMPGVFAWTKKNPLTTYLGANTCSHYRFGIKVLKRWLRQQQTRPSARKAKVGG